MTMCTLEDQAWRAVTVHAVYLAFARAEWHRLPGATLAERHLLESEDLTDAADNERRRKLLFGLRGSLLKRIPSDTVWYEVRYLEEQHLEELHLIGRSGWDHSSDQNELPRVAKRRPIELQSPPSRWSEPILWGHSRRGPFTILEGNNRLVAYAATSAPGMMQIPMFVGLSPSRCIWHLPDAV